MNLKTVSERLQALHPTTAFRIGIAVLAVRAIIVASVLLLSSSDDTYQDGDPIDSVVELTCWNVASSKTSGSGFVIDHGGCYVITNA